MTTAVVRRVAMVLALTGSPAMAQDHSLGVDLVASARVFPDHSPTAGARVSPSLAIAPAFELVSPGGAWRLVGEGFLRWDADDANRTHADLRELGLRHLGGSVAVFVGSGRIFWGVTEVNHLVDIVNQDDAVEDLDGEDKLGQPMVAISLARDWGGLDAYVLPGFRERRSPAPGARLGGPLPTTAEAVFPGDSGRRDPSLAARLYRMLGPLDLGLSLFHGTSRAPRLVVVAGRAGAPVIEPHYDRITQVGLDAQWTGEQTLLKLEAISRGAGAHRFYALSAGMERTVTRFLGSNADLGLLLELMLDSRDGDAPPTIFDRDMFLGGRLALNDFDDTSILGGMLVDLRTGERVVMLEADRRLDGAWKLGVDLRLFDHTGPGSMLHPVRRDGFLAVSLTRFVSAP